MRRSTTPPSFPRLRPLFGPNLRITSDSLFSTRTHTGRKWPTARRSPTTHSSPTRAPTRAGPNGCTAAWKASTSGAPFPRPALGGAVSALAAARLSRAGEISEGSRTGLRRRRRPLRLGGSDRGLLPSLGEKPLRQRMRAPVQDAPS